MKWAALLTSIGKVERDALSQRLEQLFRGVASGRNGAAR